MLVSQACAAAPGFFQAGPLCRAGPSGEALFQQKGRRAFRLLLFRGAGDGTQGLARSRTVLTAEPNLTPSFEMRLLVFGVQGSSFYDPPFGEEEFWFL